MRITKIFSSFKWFIMVSHFCRTVFFFGDLINSTPADSSIVLTRLTSLSISVMSRQHLQDVAHFIFINLTHMHPPVVIHCRSYQILFCLFQEAFSSGDPGWSLRVFDVRWVSVWVARTAVVTPQCDWLSEHLTCAPGFYNRLACPCCAVSGVLLASLDFS